MKVYHVLFILLDCQQVLFFLYGGMGPATVASLYQLRNVTRTFFCSALADQAGAGMALYLVFRHLDAQHYPWSVNLP